MFGNWTFHNPLIHMNALLQAHAHSCAPSIDSNPISRNPKDNDRVVNRTKNWMNEWMNEWIWLNECARYKIYRENCGRILKHFIKWREWPKQHLNMRIKSKRNDIRRLVKWLFLFFIWAEFIRFRRLNEKLCMAFSCWTVDMRRI